MAHTRARLHIALAVVVLALLTVAGADSSAPFHDASLSPRQEQQQDPSSISCKTDRAPDYYGLGVRLGIYFAWMQAYIANTMLASEIAGAVDTNMIFLLTILIAMIKCSSVNMLGQIDGLILMHLSGGTIFGVLSIWGYRTCRYSQEGPRAIRHFGGFGTHGRLLISLAVSIYGLWFWMFGVTGQLVAMGPDDGLTEINADPNPPECGELHTFMFGKVRAAGGIRIFYIIVCVCCIVYFGTMMLASTIAGYTRVSKIVSYARNKRWADTTRLRFATGYNYRELNFIFRFMRWWNLVWLVFSMLLVEFSLNFNHVTGVLGGPHDNELHLPAQLLPLLIGAFGFVRICWLKFEEWRSPEDHSPSIATTFAESPRHSRTLPTGVAGWLHVFSPALAVDAAPKPAHRPDELDRLERGKPAPLRYLVAWLPWLSLLRPFRSERKNPPLPVSAKRISDASSHDEENLPAVPRRTARPPPTEPPRPAEA